MDELQQYEEQCAMLDEQLRQQKDDFETQISSLQSQLAEERLLLKQYRNQGADNDEGGLDDTMYFDQTLEQQTREPGES